jgi:hypothetical protein
MSFLRGIVLTVRFLLAAAAFWGFHAGDGVPAWLLGLAAAGLAATGHPALAAVFAALAVTTSLLNVSTEGRASPTPPSR